VGYTYNYASLQPPLSTHVCINSKQHLPVLDNRCPQSSIALLMETPLPLRRALTLLLP